MIIIIINFNWIATKNFIRVLLTITTIIREENFAVTTIPTIITRSWKYYYYFGVMVELIRWIFGAGTEFAGSTG